VLRDCDEAAVGAAAIADLPPDGIDATAREHCVWPVLERTTLRLDRRGRTTVAIGCPATGSPCSSPAPTAVGRPRPGSRPLAQLILSGMTGTRPSSAATLRSRCRNQS
jgi:hypothetical protein